MDVMRACARVLALFVVTACLSPQARADEQASDPMWRSPWTVSFGAGATPISASFADAAACEPDCTTSPWWSSGVAFDALVPFALWSASAGGASFELGPRVILRIPTPSWFRANPYAVSFVLMPEIGLDAGFRFRPNPPASPGGPGVFEWGLRLGVLGGPSFSGGSAETVVVWFPEGVVFEGLVEWWGGWSLPEKWRPPSPVPVERSARRTAVVVGPFVRGGVGLSGGSGAVVRAEAGIRVDIRREARVTVPQ